MMREMRWSIIVLVACSSKAPAPTTQPVVEAKPAAICTDGFVGGYAGTPECKVTAETPIRGADRSCTANEDCIRLGPHCAPFAIRADRTDAFSSVPCTDPASGQCPPPCAAVCRDGCCVIPAGWGENCR
jgi:hypothetical protein